ncbi:hypothetical protein SPYCA_3504 [Sphingopyxis sp. FD7]|nr:hypothetical protein SPYCA_3504 [Sphingopyxis sp. FD7]
MHMGRDIDGAGLRLLGSNLPQGRCITEQAKRRDEEGKQDKTAHGSGCRFAFGRA